MVCMRDDKCCLIMYISDCMRNDLTYNNNKYSVKFMCDSHAPHK